MSMVENLQKIHNSNFLSALGSIKTKQIKYKKYYDRRNKVKNFNLQPGDKVQYLRYSSKKPKSKRSLGQWCPLKSYYIIFEILMEKKTVVLQTREGLILKRRQSFDRLRKFRGKI